MVVATRVRFDTPFGYTVATQLAFVPLLFALPLAIVPLAVVAAMMLARLPELISGEHPPARLIKEVGNSWFAIGPVAVFALARCRPGRCRPGAPDRRAGCAVRRRLRRLNGAIRPRTRRDARRPAPRYAGSTSSMRPSRSWGSSSPNSSSDVSAGRARAAADAGIARPVRPRAPRADEGPDRAQQRLPGDRARARRRGGGRRWLYRRALQERRSARACARRPPRSRPRTTPQPRVRRAPARRRQDRDPQGDHQQARQARP